MKQYFKAKTAIFAGLIIVLFSIGASQSAARSLAGDSGDMIRPAKTTVSIPNVSGAVHNVGKIGLSITNEGNFGTGFIGNFVDSSTGLAAPSCQYPYPSRLDYLFGASFWIGAVVGRDTLVSTGADGWAGPREMWPAYIGYPHSGIEHHSIKDPNDTLAVSEQDYIAVYSDTVTNPSYVAQDQWDGRPHVPLNIEITQRTFAWSYAYAEDFVLFDYSIKNIGNKKLNKVYMGVYVDADVKTIGSAEGYADDICGFKREIPSSFGCGFRDTVNIAWIADNNGLDNDLLDQCPYSSSSSLTSVTGLRVVRTPSDSLKYSFNWWISNTSAPLDFGPRRIGTPEDPFRDFGGFLGTPEGDRNKYYIMRHEEFDYDQLFSAVDNTASGWLPKAAQAIDFADGFDTRYLLSFGPFDINPGEVLPVSFAYVAGENFHTRCEAWKELFNAIYPEAYYDYLNFSDFGKNALWASWIYDNPGYDTDGDSVKGKFRVCVYDSSLIFDTIQFDPLVIETTVTYLKADTSYYEGDGVPDFRGAAPPPAPKMWIYPQVNRFNEGELRVRFNGYRSETERDVFSRLRDFEGYRIYQSLTGRASDFVVITSYDKADFNKYIWNSDRGFFELKDPPFTLDSLRRLYGESFDPAQYARDYPFYWMDSTFYFNRQDWNQSSLTDSNLIHKIYPDQVYPTTLNLDSARQHFPEELTADGYFKYFEYEYNLKHLLPSQLYYIAVTAFDYGSPASGLESLESAPAQNSVGEYAQNQNGVVEAARLNVIAYPNPYRLDADYQDSSGGKFEGRGLENLMPDRKRAIHFMNLPNKCTIRIFSLDGDLIREINHDYPKDSPRSMHDTWDLITRNTQMVVSGIYYYSVESEFGNQLGKLVIIM
ncbi:conserved exported hypothetical protein [Candidatus Zixiibacteriota bacterium]|nr:conserved exported hypothetical protein [candidate division Zixibacteria bacterium]